MLRINSSTNTRKGQSQVAKVQHLNMECASAKGVQSQHGARPTLAPRDREVKGTEVSWLRGSVKYGMSQAMFAPNPLLLLLGPSSVLGFLLFWSVLVWFFAAKARAPVLPCCKHM